MTNQRSDRTWETMTALALFALIGAGGGCSHGGPKLYPATGHITFNDEPLANAGVVFAPDDRTSSARLATGRTNDVGAFKLETNLRSGIAAGIYTVTVFAAEENHQDSDRSEAPLQRAKAIKMQPPKLLIPRKYTNPIESGLSFIVAAGENNHFEIKLTGTAPE